jgi:hypothetical protein
MSSQPPATPDERVLNDVYRKIEREKVIIQGARSVRASTTNAAVQEKCDMNIREAEKNIAYLEETMRQLKMRPLNTSGAGNGATGSDVGISDPLKPKSVPGKGKLMPPTRHTSHLLTSPRRRSDQAAAKLHSA